MEIICTLLDLFRALINTFTGRDFYRPHVSVILFTGHTPGQTHPWADTPLGRHTPVRHSPGKTPPEHSPPPGQTCRLGRHSLGRHSLGRHSLSRHPSGQKATTADGTHPTGMHSCLLESYSISVNLVTFLYKIP